MSSNPTPGAIFVDSYEDFISIKKQNKIVKSLQERAIKEVNTISTDNVRIEIQK